MQGNHSKYYTIALAPGEYFCIDPSLHFCLVVMVMLKMRVYTLEVHCKRWNGLGMGLRHEPFEPSS